MLGTEPHNELTSSGEHAILAHLSTENPEVAQNHPSQNHQQI
jgi:hypothetical protein